MKSTKGFTVVELLVVVAVFATASIVFFVQKNHIEVSARDDARRTSINAIYYGLEEVYYQKEHAYPRVISSETLPSINPDQLKDPNGVSIGESNSNFRYEPLNCDGDTCKGYTLRTALEAEDDYIKTDRQR